MTQREVYRCEGCDNGTTEGTICELCGECDLCHGFGRTDDTACDLCAQSASDE